jgi:hypothetical protein
MIHAASVSRLGPEFDDFLFAPIEEDRNGTLLSVLSALARQNLDPWQEAADLARLPVETAIRRMTDWIGALPDAPSGRRDAGAIARRLIARLPRRPDLLERARPLDGGIPARLRPVVFLIIMAFALCAQWFLLGHRLPAHADHMPTMEHSLGKIVRPVGR